MPRKGTGVIKKVEDGAVGRSAGLLGETSIQKNEGGGQRREEQSKESRAEGKRVHGG